MRRFLARAGWRHAAVFLFLLTFALAAANLFFTSHTATTDDHKWCATMTLLTSRPVPKPVHPAQDRAREQDYRFYETFLDLRQRLGC